MSLKFSRRILCHQHNTPISNEMSLEGKQLGTYMASEYSMYVNSCYIMVWLLM